MAHLASRRQALLALTGVGVLMAAAGCTLSAAPPQTSTRSAAEPETGGAGLSPEAKVTGVTAALMALGPAVDRDEAARVARVAVHAPLGWAEEWQVVDPPLLHNIKVTNGLREKGVCRDWANALHAALRPLGLRTLELHIGMANARNVSLEHVSVIVAARGAPMHSGLLLDPWRVGQGRLWYARVSDDPRYRWETLAAVRAWQAANTARALKNL